jgi:hypothetical protein
MKNGLFPQAVFFVTFAAVFRNRMKVDNYIGGKDFAGV